MIAPAPLANFSALDACHRQTLEYLQDRSDLSRQIDDEGPSEASRQRARAIDAFFSGTSHDHHGEEEATVFPPLLASTDPELVQAVERLQQDHGWIERNWALLGPQLRAVAKGESWPDPGEFQHGVDIFVQLYLEHIALEETLIYPQSKAHWAKVVAQREPRRPL